MLRESGPRVAYVSWWLAGLLVLPGCFGLFAQPKPPPKAPGARVSGEKDAKEAAAQARARASGWDVRLPDLSPIDPEKEGAAARAEPKAATGASGWKLQSPNLHPKAPVSVGEGQASGWKLQSPNLDPKAAPAAEGGRASGWEVEPPSLATAKEEEAAAPEEGAAPEGAAAPGAAAVPSNLIQTAPGELAHRGATLLEVLLLLYNNVANGGLGIGFGALDHLDFLFFIGGGDIGKGGFIAGVNSRFPFLQGMLKPFAQVSLLGGYSDSIEGFGSFTVGVGLQVDFSRSVGVVFGLDFGVIFGNMRRGFDDKFLFALSLGPQFRF